MRMSRWVVPAVGLACVYATPAANAEQGQKTQSTSNQIRIQVVDAQDVVGTKLSSIDGRDLGEIKYLLINSSNGRMRYVVMQADDDLKKQMASNSTDQNADLVAIPWASVQKNFDRDKPRFTAARDQVLRAPLVSNDTLHQLLSPTMVTRIEEYWAPVKATGSSETHGSSADQKNAAANTEDRSKPQGQGRDQSEATGSKGSTGGSSELDVLVGQTAITTLVPSPISKVGALRDSEVISSDGKDVGEVKKVAIDVEAGRVAYLLLGRGGFLGLGEDVIPVPFEAVKFRGPEQPLQLTVNAQKVQQMTAFKGGQTPRQIRQSDLAQLYDRFGVKPYWTTSAPNASSS